MLLIRTYLYLLDFYFCQRSEWASEASRDRAEILLGAVPLGFAITLDDGADQH